MHCMTMFIPSVEARLPSQNLLPSILVQLVVDVEHRLDPLLRETEPLPGQGVVKLLRRGILPVLLG